MGREDIHPDEGSIHAWLDGELGVEDASALERHVAACASCAALVAEARGLIAGSSRVVGMLDESPARTIHASPAIVPVRVESSIWRALRVTPARSAIAATLIVAVGIILTRDRAGLDTTTPSEVVTAPALQDAPSEAKGDTQLASAIAEKLRREQPVPVLNRAPGVSVNAPEADLGGGARLDPAAKTRVAAARASLDAQRDQAVSADRARVGVAGGVARGVVEPVQQVTEAANAAERSSAAGFSTRASGAAAGIATAGACLRVETSDRRGGKWGTMDLPVILAFDSAGRVARVVTPAGQFTQTQSVAMRADDDTMVIRLRQIGFVGTMELGANAERRSGLLRSAEDMNRLEEVVVTGAGLATRAASLPPGGDSVRRRQDSLGARQEARSASRVPPAAAPVAKALAPAPAPASPAAAAAGVPITVSKVACPRP